ncbi:ATP-binding cassette domain-containing protein [Candidatus Neptunochlamydia vexilliferae]|nr:ABC transporter ATP-binding protein [Candidatus Neptunochlamydia vexilliferae]
MTRPSKSEFKTIFSFLYRALWKSNKAIRHLFLGAKAIALLHVSAAVLSPLLLKALIECFEGSTAQIFGHSPLLLVVAYGIVWMASQLLPPLKEIWSTKITEGIGSLLGQEYLGKLHEHPADSITAHSSGYFLGLFEKANGSIKHFVNEFILTVIPNILQLVLLAGFVMYEIGTLSGLILLSASIILTISTNYGLSKALHIRRLSNTYERKLPERFIDSLLNFEIVQLFNLQKREAKEFGYLLTKKRDAEVNFVKNFEFLHLRQLLIFGSTFLGLNILVVHGILQGTYRVSDFVFLNSVFLQLMTPVAFIGEYLRDTFKSAVDLLPFVSWLKPPTTSTSKPPIKKKISQGKIVFDCVDFRYGKNPLALEKLSFSLAANSKTILIGPSGCGKTTIVKLLLGLYSPSGGKILIDDIPLTDYDLPSLREEIGVVSQDTILFNDTIASNIACAKVGAKWEEIEQAARAAHLEPFVNGLPDGYQTRVGERGIKISGGEKQRIALARVFLRNPKIIIFDEATNAIDPKTKEAILDFINDFCQNKTVIQITHQYDKVSSEYQIINLGEAQLAPIPIPDQNLRVCQSQRSRFSPIEAVPYPGDRGDAEGGKGGDAGTEKPQILNQNGYN